MISRYFAFLIIEYKKALRCICHMLFSITLSIGLILGGIAGAGLLLYHSGLLDPVKVGVIVADESRSLNIAINMLESMESFTSVCEIVTIPDEDTALSMLESRELASIVVLPPHFTRISCTAQIRLPGSSRQSTPFWNPISSGRSCATECFLLTRARRQSTP